MRRSQRVFFQVIFISGFIIAIACSAAFGANIMVPQQCTDNPSISSVTPPTVSQGQMNVSLTLMGKDLDKPSVALDFGPGIVLVGRPIPGQIVNDLLKIYTVNINVMPTAQTGQHNITVRFCNGTKTLNTQSFITVLAGVQAIMPDRSDRIAPPITRCTDNPTVSSAAPQVLSQGQSNVQLTITGRDLDKPGVTLDFGAGIIVLGPAQRRSAAMDMASYAVTLNVLPSAPFGPHFISVRFCNGTQTQQTQSFVTIVPGRSVSPQLPISLNHVLPNKWEPGKTYQLTLNGVNLTDGMEVQFGEGVKNKGALKVFSPVLAQMEVEVDIAAKGQRNAQMRMAASEAWKVTSARAVIQPLEAVKPVKKVGIKLPVFQPELAPKGVILLDKPLWREQIGSQAPPKGPDGKWLGQPTPVYQLKHPVLNDALVFDWHEQHFGVAEWFEIRFFRKGALVAKRKIEEGKSWLGKTILPSYFRPDGALVAELLKTESAKPGGKGTLTIVPGALQGSSQSLETVLSGADLAWEVAGYRRYATNGVVKTALADSPILFAAAQGQQGGVMTDAPAVNPAMAQQLTMKDVEVEISERWPLYAPDRPTGLNCGSDVGKSFLLSNIDKKDVSATENHPYDRWTLTGSFSLGNSPYAAHVSTSQTSTPDTSGSLSTPFGGSVSYGSESQILFTTWSFENVFIDWGDGTVHPLHITKGGDAGKFSQETPLDLSKAVGTYEHFYTEPGTYTVRLYHLSNDDVQKPQAGSASYIIDAQAGIGGLYAEVVALGGGGLAESYPVAKTIADRAYMPFCQKITISPRHDPLAEGPLRLTDIVIQGFPGFAANEPALTPKKKTPSAKQPSAASGAGAKKSAATLSQSPSGGASMQQVSDAVTAGALASSLLASQSGTDVFTSCDVSLTAGARLQYYGKGQARIRWFLDGVSLGAGDIWPLGPSPARSQDVLAGKTGGNIFKKMFEAMPILGAEAPIPSPSFAVGMTGAHAVRVEAEVVHDAKSSNLKDSLTQALLGKDTALAAGLVDELKGGPKIGVLSPLKTPVPGWTSTTYLNDSLSQLAAVSRGVQYAAVGTSFGGSAASVSDAVTNYTAGIAKKNAPPDYVVSGPRPYTVKKPAEGPCTFDFPVKDGKFLITGLQDAATGKFNVTHVGDVYSGKGTLRLKLPTASGSVAEWPVPVSFKDWLINADGFTVDKGNFEINAPGLPELPVPAVRAKLASVKGTAKDHVDAAFTFKLSNSGLTDVLSAQTVPSWPLPVTAPLTPSGDWYASGLSMPEILIYDTGFRFKPGSVAIDLSTSEGDAHTSCKGTGKAFMGVRMSNATLTAYDFDLPGANTATVDTWGIDSSGICGFAKTGAFQADYLKGKMSWDSVTAVANNGDFTGTYQNLRVKVPWLNAELKGSTNPVLKSGTGKVTMMLTGSDVQVKNGPITFTATNLTLETYKISDSAGNIPAVRTDTKFDFSGGDKPFAKDVWVNSLYFGLNGKAYLKGSATLGNSSGTIGKAPITLKSIAATAPAAGAARLRFDFTGDVTLSKSGTLVGTAPVTYGIDEPADGKYAGYGPMLGTLKFETEFPKTTKATKASITVKSVDLSGATSTAMTTGPVQLAFNDTAGSGSILADAYPSFISLAAADNPQIVFKGSVDLGMFPGLSGAMPGGGAPAGGFVLGYVGDKDFWSAKVSYSLPGSGIVIVPEIVHMRGLNGGLGYNVEKASLQHPNLEHAVPATGNGMMLNVGINVGSGDGVIYTLQGDMTIPRSAGDFTPQLDFRGWIFRSSPAPSSQEDVTGFVTYSSGLHGEIWSPQPKKIIDDYVWVNVPKGSTAVHFGTGDWYIHVGTPANKIKGHLFVMDADAYLMLGLKDGLKVGGGGSFSKELGDCEDGFCVYIKGSISVDGSIALSPLHVSASAKASGKVGGCYEDHCLGIGGGLKATASALPPDLAFGVSLDLPCPVPDVTGGIRLLLTPGLWGPSLDWCDLNPFW